MNALGTHLLLDLRQVSSALLDDERALETRLVEAAGDGGAQVVESRFHRFEPQGVSGIVILKESHLAVHTWPEFGFAAVDVFTCGRSEIAEAVAARVIGALGAAESQIRRLERGQPPKARAV